MEHSISKNTNFGRSELSVLETKDGKGVCITVVYIDHNNKLIDAQGITLDSKEFYDFIGTMLFVQSKLKRNGK